MRRFGRPMAALLLASVEGWGALWVPRALRALLEAFGPLSLLPPQKIFFFF